MRMFVLLGAMLDAARMPTLLISSIYSFRCTRRARTRNDEKVQPNPTCRLQAEVIPVRLQRLACQIHCYPDNIRQQTNKGDGGY